MIFSLYMERAWEQGNVSAICLFYISTILYDLNKTLHPRFCHTLISVQCDKIGGNPLKVTQFHFTSWPDHGVPEYAGPILNYLCRMKAQMKVSRGPTLVHCRSVSGVMVRLSELKAKYVCHLEDFMTVHHLFLLSLQCWCREDRHTARYKHGSGAGCPGECGGHPCHCH